ncbi:hypothetical protein L3Q67_01085 [Saccharothrix sp. AJ9571]|nr:hypothetical protein L3Q67_01085 [Saccharothrix sp. AJ9571]
MPTPISSAPVSRWRRIGGPVAAVLGGLAAALLVALGTAGQQPAPAQLPPYPAPVTTPARAPQPPPADPHRTALTHERTSTVDMEAVHPSDRQPRYFFGGDPGPDGVTVVDELDMTDGVTALDTWRQTTGADEWTSDTTGGTLPWRELCDTRAPLREVLPATDQPAGGDA